MTNTTLDQNINMKPYYVTGRSIEGRVYWDGSNWSKDKDSAVHLSLADATHVFTKQQLTNARNMHRISNDGYVGWLEIKHFN